jgi:hypothetical protein
VELTEKYVNMFAIANKSAALFVTATRFLQIEVIYNTTAPDSIMKGER